MDGKDILVRDFYRRRTDAIQKCALVAARHGYKVFAVQHQGWCATGPRAHLTYRKYGPSRRCRNGKGGPWANDVYLVSGKLTLSLLVVAKIKGQGKSQISFFFSNPAKQIVPCDSTAKENSHHRILHTDSKVRVHYMSP